MSSPRRDRHPFLENLPFIVVMALVGVAALRVAQYNWREGGALVAGALLVASVLRAVLNSEQAGLLAIRGKAVDVLSYAALGVLILFIALTISRGPGPLG